MSSLSINDESIDNYFGYLMHLDNRSKKRLIIKLTDTSKLRHLFGAWEDDRETKEIIDDIRASQTKNREVEDFE